MFGFEEVIVEEMFMVMDSHEVNTRDTFDSDNRGKAPLHTTTASIYEVGSSS